MQIIQTVFRAAIFTTTLCGLAAHAATFKCVVDGNTTYQAIPCAGDVAARGTESKLTAPARPGDRFTPQVTTKNENDQRSAQVKTSVEPLARDAFAALKSGSMMSYRDMLCLRGRQSMNNPLFAEGMKTQGASYVKRNVTLASVESASSSGVLFIATEIADPKLHKPGEKLIVRVQAEWEDNKACIGGVSDWRSTK